MIRESVILDERLESLEDLTRVSEKLAARFRFGDWIWLQGPLGAGKTSCVRAILKAWGFEGPVTSPTYVLMQEYEVWERRVIHVDAYRLGKGGEIPWDIREWKEAIVFVEWPEVLAWGAERFKYRVEIDFEGAQNTRHFRLISLENS